MYIVISDEDNNENANEQIKEMIRSLGKALLVKMATSLHAKIPFHLLSS